MAKVVRRTNPVDVADLYIRFILSDISEIIGECDEIQLAETIRYFENKCAYTGVPLAKGFVLDLLIPTNREFCGLNLYGNIVPACKDFTNAKGSKNYKDFILNDIKVLANKKLKERKEILERIEIFRVKSNYDERIKKIENIQDYCNNQYKKIIDLCSQNHDFFVKNPRKS